MKFWFLEIGLARSKEQSNGCQDCGFDSEVMEDMRKRLERTERMVYRNRKRYSDDGQDDSDDSWLHSLKVNGQ